MLLGKCKQSIGHTNTREERISTLVGIKDKEYLRIQACIEFHRRQTHATIYVIHLIGIFSLF